MRILTWRALHIEGFDFASYLAAVESDSEESAGEEGYADHATFRQNTPPLSGSVGGAAGGGEGGKEKK